MSAKENSGIAKRFVEEVLNRGNFDLVDEVFAPDFVNHFGPPGIPPGAAGFKQVLRGFRAAFPDLHVEIEDLVTEGDKVVCRFASSGTHQGALMGVPPTGKRVTWTAICIDRYDGGKIVERWEVTDMLGMMAQLGVTFSPGRAG